MWNIFKKVKEQLAPKEKPWEPVIEPKKKKKTLNIIQPIKNYPITSTFGIWSKYWKWYFDKEEKIWKRGQINGKGQHTGYDYACPEGTLVYAVAKGLIEYAGWDDPKGKGFGIYIRHMLKDGTKAYYGHLSTYMVKPGELVRQRQVIAKTGNTGGSTGAHLHFGLRKNNQPREISFI